MNPREQARAAAAQALAELRQLRERLAAPRPLAQSDWSALRLQQRLREPAPEASSAAQFGPLNTALLVPRVLRRLQQLSPAYLQRLATQLDALALLPEASELQPASRRPRSGASPASGAAKTARRTPPR